MFRINGIRLFAFAIVVASFSTACSYPRRVWPDEDAGLEESTGSRPTAAGGSSSQNVSGGGSAIGGASSFTSASGATGGNAGAAAGGNATQPPTLTGGSSVMVPSSGGSGTLPAVGGASNAGGTPGLGGAAAGSTPATGATSSSSGGSPSTQVVPTGGNSGAGGAVTGGANATGGAADTTPPTVVPVAPLDGAKAITADATITLQFSEPMNTSSVASALTVTGVLAADLGLQWNDNATTLQITPKTPLLYATGGDSKSVSAKVYTVSIGQGARDLAGNALAAPFATSFSTLRRIASSIAAHDVICSDTFTKLDKVCDAVFTVGLWSSSRSGGHLLGYAVFDVSSIEPANQLFGIESAKLFALQSAATGNFYDISSVRVSKIQYHPELTGISTYEVLADIGTLATSNTPSTVSINVLDSFRNEFVGSGVKMHMYKLDAAQPTGDYSDTVVNANFDSSRFHLDVTYLIP